MRLLAGMAILGLALVACSDSAKPATSSGSSSAARATTTGPPTSTAVAPSTTTAGGPLDIYAADRPNQLSPTVSGFPSRIYVPNSMSNTVDVIDPATNAIVDHFAVGAEPQHVVPSYDLKTLYVASDQGNSLTPIDPATGAHGAPIPVDDPYNLYFTPDGRFAIVVAERLARLDFRDPHSFELVKSLPIACSGIDHMDFSADGTYLIASCEFSGELVKVTLDGARGPAVAGAIRLGAPSKPQDVKTSPDGAVFYVADMDANGVWEIDGASLSVIGFVPTGAGTHGLYVSRDSKDLYISNRGDGTVSVLDLVTRQVRVKWTIPGTASPDMGGVSADGTLLWLSGRYNGEVYALDTTTGELRARIAVGAGPHGLCVYPQPGRYSLGHTGVFR